MIAFESVDINNVFMICLVGDRETSLCSAFMLTHVFFVINYFVC